MNETTVAALIDRLLCEYCSWYRLDGCPCTTRPIDARRLQAAHRIAHREAVRRAKTAMRAAA